VRRSAGGAPTYAGGVGAIHFEWVEIEEAARHGHAWAGEVAAVRAPKHEVGVRVDRTLERRLPERPGFLARLVARFRPAKPPAPELRTFALAPPPVATDPYSHPVFLRLAGAVPVDEVRAGDRVFVVQAMVSTELLRDDPPTRARVLAAFDRTADVAWAAGATVDELHLGLVSRDRCDVALAELRWRRAAGRGGIPRSGRAALARLLGSLRGHASLGELQPLYLLLDPGDASHRALVEFARVRLAMLLEEEPSRASEFARLAAKVRVDS